MKKLTFIILAMISLTACALTKVGSTGSMSGTLYATGTGMISSEYSKLNAGLQVGYVGEIVFKDVAGLFVDSSFIIPVFMPYSWLSYEDTDSIVGNRIAIGPTFRVANRPDVIGNIAPYFEITNMTATLGSMSRRTTSFGLGIDMMIKGMLKENLNLGIAISSSVQFYQMHRLVIGGETAGSGNSSQVMLSMNPRIFWEIEL